jgi:hypothetical protein
MQKYIKIYLDYFDLGEQDLITCEACLKQGRVDGSGFDIHHVNGRSSKHKDDIKNLICLCRKHHTMAHESISKSEIQYMHNFYLTGRRKQFLK